MVKKKKTKQKNHKAGAGRGGGGGGEIIIFKASFLAVKVSLRRCTVFV